MARRLDMVEFLAALRGRPATEQASLVREEMARLHTELLDLDRQLGDAKSKVYREGVYADADWFRRAENARRSKGRQVQLLQEELGRIRRETHSELMGNGEAASGSLPRKYLNLGPYFMMAAGEVLTVEQYARLCERAKQIRDAGGKNGVDRVG